jgi:hypothetical protein
LGKRTGYIFLESPDQQEELASYLKDREAEGLKSVHFYFPNDLDASTKLSITWSLMPDFQPELRLSQISVSKRNKTIIFDSTLTRVWLLSFTESKSVQSVFADNPTEVITYTPDGRMSVVIIDPKRKPPAGLKPTDAEADELYRTMIAYSGAYSLEGNKVTHKIEVSWNQAWTGTNQQRFLEVKDDQLIIKTPPIISPISGKESVSTLVWERVK